MFCGGKLVCQGCAPCTKYDAWKPMIGEAFPNLAHQCVLLVQNVGIVRQCNRLVLPRGEFILNIVCKRLFTIGAVVLFS